MRSFEWYNLNLYHIMGSWWKSSFSKNTQKHVFRTLSLNISYKIHFFFGEKFCDTRHLCEKNEPTLDHFGGGGAR